jgi:hypothetical protein
VGIRVQGPRCCNGEHKASKRNSRGRGNCFSQDRRAGGKHESSLTEERLIRLEERISTDKQSEASIADQQRRYHEYARARDWVVTRDCAADARQNDFEQGYRGVLRGNVVELMTGRALNEPRKFKLEP